MLGLVTLVWLLTVTSDSAAAAGGKTDSVTVLTILTALSVTAGVGGMGGTLIAWRKIKAERQSARETFGVSLRELDVDVLKTLVPGGMGEIIDRWRAEADGWFEEVKSLRALRQGDHAKILQLETNLALANARIAILEGHHP